MLAQPFSIGGSFVHRMDPRAKIVAAIVWSVALVVPQDLHVLAVALAAAAVFVGMARLSFGTLIRRMAIVNVFIAFVWLFVPWSLAGETWVRLGPIVVTREGVLFAAQLTLRCNAIVLACLALLATSPLLVLSRSLRSLRVPDKIVLVLFFCVQYIQVIHDEYGRMTAAMRLRGFEPRTNVRAYRTYANLVGMLFVRSHDRASRVRDAMLCRGFQGHLHGLDEPRLTAKDIVLAGGVIAIAAVLIMWECTTRL